MAYSLNPKPSCRPESYSATHDYVRAVKGSASDHTCTECGGQAQQWALLPFYPGTVRMSYGLHANKAFNPDASAYVAMCRRDHARLDSAVRATVKATDTESAVAA